MAEDLEMGTEQLAEMTANAEASIGEASIGTEANLAQELPVDAALELDAAKLQAQNDTPASFDINNMVPGGPGDGVNFGQQSAPVRPNVSSRTPDPSDFLKSMNKIIDSNANEIFVNRHKNDVTVGPKARYAGADIDMFRNQDDFDPQGFNYFNPEKQKGYIEAETWGSALGKGIDSFATRFGNTFTDHFASYGRIGDALINWDWDKLKYTESEMVEANYAEYKDSMKNYVFVPPEEDDDILSKRSISEFVGNAGFALGTFAGFGLELAADAVITAFTVGGGAASFGATATRMAAKEAAMAGSRAAAKGFAAGAKTAAFKFTDFVADMGKGAFHFANQSTDALSMAGKVTQKANQAKVVANAGKVGTDALRTSMKEVFDIYTLNLRNIVKSKSFNQLAGNIAKGVPILGTGIRYGEKVAAGVKGGLSTGKLVGIGLQGTRRMLQEFNMSSTEANFEAVTAYGTTLDMMVNQYRADHEGENPSATEFAKMEELSLKSASSNYNTNLGILLVTNRFQFGSLFNRFAGANKWTKEILQEGAANTLGINRMWSSSKLLAKTYQKGFMGTYGLLGKIGKDFGRKQALYEFGKQFSKDLLRFEVIEGLQENLQEMSGAAWKYYYAGQYNGYKYTLEQAFDKGLGEQFTKQGFRTFLQGALTGSMIRPVTHTVGKFTNYLNEKAMERSYKDNPAENPYVKMKEQLKRDIKLQNDLMGQMSAKKFEDNVINFTNQVDSSLAQTEAAAKGHQYEWQNAKDNAVLSGAMAANRSGTTAMYQQALREMGKTMTNEEFEAAFGIKLEDTKYNSTAEFTEAMAKDVKKYSDTIDGIRKKVKNLPDPLMYEAGSKERLVSTIMHNAQEEAIRIIALNAMKATRASERAQAISQDLLKIPGFANSSEYALRVLANPESFKGESGNMLSEIKLLEESLKQGVDFTPEQKKTIQEKLNSKKELLDTYNSWFNFWDNREQLLEREDSKTGEKGEQKEKVYDTFTGVPFKAKEYDEDGVLINEEATVYSLDHKDAIETFRKFINLRNKDAGITDQISEEDLREAFDKVVDFMRLDQDQKDYMRSMDLLFNPDYYRQTITSIQDGRFKYEILELVDGLNDRLFNVIKYVVSSSDLEDPVEKLQLAFKIFEELSTTVKGSDYYKNLVLIGIDENTGLQNAKFAQENLTKLNEVIEDKIAEILDSYASQEVTGDISDLEYEDFQKTKKVPGYVMSMIGRKLAKEETLSDRQSEVYEANKDQIDAIIARLNINKNAGPGMSDISLVGVAKERLVETGEFEIAELDTMNEKDLLSLAVEKNVITEEEAVEHYSGKAVEVISDEIYNAFKQTQEVEDIVLENIARRDLDDIELSPREQEIMQAKVAEISEIQSIIEDERVRSEEENAPITESEEEVVPQVLEQADDVEEKTTDTVGGTISNAESAADETDKLFETLYGTGKDGTNKEENEQEPFVVKGTEEEGFEVVSRNGIPLSNEKIQSENEAVDLANNLNATRSNIDWSTEFLGDLSKDEEAQYKLDRMVRGGQTSLRAYNKANETEITTLEDYYKLPEGKRNLNDIKESILTNVPLSKIKQKRKKVAKEEAEQSDLFENTTSSFVGGPALPMQSIQDLFDRLESTDNVVEEPTTTTSDLSLRQKVELRIQTLRKENPQALENLDPLLQEAAKMMISYNEKYNAENLEKNPNSKYYVAPSSIQRKWKIGFLRTDKMISQLESLGIAGPVITTTYEVDTTDEDWTEEDGYIGTRNSQELLITSQEEIDLIFENLKKPTTTTTDTKNDVDLKFNVFAPTQKGGEFILTEDTSFKMNDEGWQERRIGEYDKTNVDERGKVIKSAYYIKDGILGVIIPSKDFMGRPRGYQIVNVKVPDGFNEGLFKELLKNITYGPGNSNLEQTNKIIAEIKDAIQMSVIQTTTDTKADVNAKSEYKQVGKTVGVFKAPVGNKIPFVVEPNHPNAKNTVWKIEEKNGRYFVSGLRDMSQVAEIASMVEVLVKPIFNENNRYEKNEPQVIFILEPAELQKNSDGTYTLLKKGLLRYHTLELTESEKSTYNRANVTVVPTDTKNDAESSEKNSKFVSKETISEETILDQLRKINSCFK